MKKVFLITFLLSLLVVCEDVLAQYRSGVFFSGRSKSRRWKRFRNEVFIGGVATNFLGELGGANRIGSDYLGDFDFPATRAGLEIGHRYRTTRQTAIKTRLIYAYLSGNDKLTTERFRNNRNLHFRSPIIELSSQFEFMFIQEKKGHIYRLRGVKGMKFKQISSCIFVGLGGFYFNPRAEAYDGKWYSLRRLSTEGQKLVPTRNTYSPIQIVIPFGIGIKYALTTYWSVGIEYGMRKTFTDYIDDVSTTYFDRKELLKQKGEIAEYLSNPSHTRDNPTHELYGSTFAGEQRGDPRDKDSYMFAVVTLYLKVRRGGFAIPKF